ncbi:MAG: hypothetical protein JWM16_6450 [Verrucomicrobiales bacterium]|nr:hypothetical protein [Verrucomicrobiales bacterium]
MSGPALIAELGLDGRGYEKGLKSASDKTANFAQHINTQIGGALNSVSSGNPLMGIVTRLTGGFLGGAGFAFVGSLIKKAQEASDKVAEQVKETKQGALRTGLDHDTFQRVRNVMMGTGSSMEAFIGFMDHVAVSQEAAKEGGEAGAKAMKQFATVGVSSAEVVSQSYEDLSIQIFKFLKNVDLTGERLAALKGIGGRGAVEVFPAAKKGLDSPLAEKNLVSEAEINRQTKLKESTALTDAAMNDASRGFGRLLAKIFYEVPFKLPWLGLKNAAPGLGRDLGGGEVAPRIKDARVDAEMEQFHAKDEFRRQAIADTEAEERDMAAMEVALERSRVEAEPEYAAKEREKQLSLERSTAAERFAFEQQIFGLQEKAMSNTEREAALRKKIAEHMENAAAFKGVGMEYEALDEANMAAARAGELSGLFQSESFKPTSDSLSRIGGFTGGSGASQGGGIDGVSTKMDTLINAVKSGILIRGEN